MARSVDSVLTNPKLRESDAYLVRKRLLDISIVTTALIFLAPLILVLSALIFLSQGRPLIYRQKRIGLNGKTFSCLKFRSMITNSDVVLKEHLASNPDAAREWAETQKLKADPRVTKLGSFLRKSSLDELPQLFNILNGDMSLVGPRPIVPDELQRYGRHAKEYVAVRPGLTGLWQISGRSDCSYETRVRLDTSYVQSMSLSKDIGIIVRTIPVVLSRRGSI